MADPLPKRRWFRFSLRTLFVVVTLFGCWLSYELRWIHNRHAFLAEEAQIRQQRLPAKGMRVGVTNPGAPGQRPTAPWLLWAFGEDGFANVFILAEADGADQLIVDDRARIGRGKSLFPEATVKTVHVRWSNGLTTAEAATPR